MDPVLVVGATGQLGTAIVERIRAAGRRVRALVRPTSPRDFDSEGVTRLDEGPVFEPPHPPEDEAHPGGSGLQQPAGCMHDRLDHHHSGKNGKPRKVILQVFLGERDLLDGHNAVRGLFDDGVEEVEMHGAG